MKVLVTGGCGYIGSHTIVDLVQQGYDVLCVDNNIRSDCAIHTKIKELTHLDVTHYTVDLCDRKALYTIFQENPNIESILHFAALKAVGESVEQPLLYYENNTMAMVNILSCMKEFNVRSFIFSSSCTIYGDPDSMPVTEDTPMKPARSPYGATKQMCEQMLRDFIHAYPEKQACILRYFNPAGAHPSLLIGENPTMGIPSLTSAIVHSVKEEKTLYVFGCDYTTKDGTCIRDFIHVCDIARAHRLALEYLKNHPFKPICLFNLGAGEGHTVLEAIQAFSTICPKKFEMDFQERRLGDVEAIYADCSLAKEELGWEPRFTLQDIMKTAWQYELQR